MVFKIGLIILAAGSATRMGRPKQLLSYQGRSLILHAVEVALASLCQPIIVVLGAYVEQIKPELMLKAVQVVENSQWQEGMSSSIRAGISMLLKTNSKLDAVIISLADQPLVSPQIFNQLIQSYQETQKVIIASKYNETTGVPALFSNALFPELMQLEGDKGAKALIQKYIDTGVILLIPEAAIDIDTPDDYKQLLLKNFKE
ncbi:nucleotidyltransferase family protein [Microcoleus sp. Pol7_A1]|uniref:nucleotidyltransferase family protein n=1 Tax=Microcoleus sp. Pol7_A1 TaxID=2818893 RepID=UPI002FD0D856